MFVFTTNFFLGVRTIVWIFWLLSPNLKPRDRCHLRHRVPWLRGSGLGTQVSTGVWCKTKASMAIMVTAVVGCRAESRGATNSCSRVGRTAPHRRGTTKDTNFSSSNAWRSQLENDDVKSKWFFFSVSMCFCILFQSLSIKKRIIQFEHWVYF